MKVTVKYRGSALGQWLTVGNVSYGIMWMCRAPIRSRTLLRAKRIYEYERFGAIWLGKRC